MPQIENTAAGLELAAAAAAVTATPVVKVSAPKGEPFRLYRRVGEDVYRMRFLLGSSWYDESTLNEVFDLAVMVARATYVEMRERLAGRSSAWECH